jgi:hypothetical protein
MSSNNYIYISAFIGEKETMLSHQALARLYRSKKLSPSFSLEETQVTPLQLSWFFSLREYNIW